MCKSLPPGKGNLYRCLYDHIHEPTMKSKVGIMHVCIYIYIYVSVDLLVQVIFLC